MKTEHGLKPIPTHQKVNIRRQQYVSSSSSVERIKAQECCMQYETNQFGQLPLFDNRINLAKTSVRAIMTNPSCIISIATAQHNIANINPTKVGKQIEREGFDNTWITCELLHGDSSAQVLQKLCVNEFCLAKSNLITQRRSNLPKQGIEVNIATRVIDVGPCERKRQEHATLADGNQYQKQQYQFLCRAWMC